MTVSYRIGLSAAHTVGAVFLLLLMSACRSSDACPTGRLYFGNVNETMPDHIHRNGVYVQQPPSYRGYPVYKHELRDEYLYYIHGNLFGGYWAIGPQVGGTDAGISVQTRARRPQDAQEEWHVWNRRRASWEPLLHTVDIICVEDNFMTCSSGEVHISGLSGKDEIQAMRMGDYRVTNITYQLRPVYRQLHGVTEEYLFYQSGK